MHQLLNLVSVGDEAMPDGQLLEAFIRTRDEAAFERLLRRHAPMVLAVCQRVLQNHHDAEDAFQATFLVLARKAQTIQPRDMVANWLYGVAYRTALEARKMRSKRLFREAKLHAPAATVSDPDVSDKEWQTLLDQELERLPDHYRVAIVLCDLEGKTQKEAACHLRCPTSTVGNRLVRGRALLAKKLARRGVTLSAAALCTVLSVNVASANVSTTLIHSTVKAATMVAAGSAVTAAVPVHVAALTQRVIKTMFLTKLKAVLTVLLVAGALAIAGAAFLVHITEASEPEHAPVPAEGFVYRLPEDGTMVRFEIETSSHDKGWERKKSYRGMLTLSSVGEVKVDDTLCRWIEMKTETQSPGDHIVKVLIPVERLKAGESPLDHAVKGWRKMIGNLNDGGLRELTNANVKTMQAGAMPIILPGPLTDAKKLPKKIIDSKLGKLECAGYTGTHAFEPGTDHKSEVTYETWLHEKAPFGVVACQVNVKTFHNGDYIRTWTMTARLVEAGKGARSELPDQQ